MCEYFENIIVGSGPAGIQMGYFFEKHKKDYIILEKSEHKAPFFRMFPRHRRLISVNKTNCGKNNDRVRDIENILRYDWNSLLTVGDDVGKLLFRDFSEEYYPSADKLIDYLEAFVELFNIQIVCNTCVVKIAKIHNGFTLSTSGSGSDGGTYKCKNVFVATGLSCKRIAGYTPPESFYYYDTMPVDPLVYKNKNVLIVGGGNAAFETANFVNEYCNKLTVCGAERFGWKTHYPGGIRSVNMKIIDSYYLKLKVNLDWTTEDFARNDPKYKNYIESIKDKSAWNNNDIVIYCGGFAPNTQFIDTELMVQENGFPKLTPCFESIVCKQLFFIGSLSQHHDFKHGTSAFIHGFRYNCRFLFDYLYNKNGNGVVCMSAKHAVISALRQLNQSSHLLHRFDYFGDYIIMTSKHFYYFKHVPLQFIHDAAHLHQWFKKDADAEDIRLIVQVYLGYDPKNVFQDTFRQPQTGQPSLRNDSVFIHPIFKVFTLEDTEYKMRFEFHLPENAFNEFSGYNYHFSLTMHFFSTLTHFQTYTFDAQLLEAFDKSIDHRCLHQQEIESIQDLLA